MTCYPWLGARQSRWPTVPIRKVCHLGTGHTPDRSQPEFWREADCDVPWVTVADIHRLSGLGLTPLEDTEQHISELGLAHSAAVLHPPGTVMVSRTASIGFACRIARPMATTQAFVTWTPGPSVDSRYLLLVAKALGPEFDRLAYGSTHLTIYMPDLESVSMPLPPLTTQRAIADYVERQAERVDALIAAKQRMVGLLDERLAIYTRRLLMAGDHLLRPLKRAWRVIDCKHRTPSYVDHGYPVISPGDTTPGRLDLSRAHRFVGETDYRDLTAGGRRPRKGDIVYSRNASIGIAAFVDTELPFCMGQDVCLISSDSASQLFLTYFLNSLGLDQLEEQKVGSTFSRVNIAQILELIVPTPPRDDQLRVARRIDEQHNSQAAIVDALESQIALLEERRQSLIAAAVTGQLEVPEAV